MDDFMMIVPDHNDYKPLDPNEPCPTCEGKGYIDDNGIDIECNHCFGLGYGLPEDD